ncbi:MAG TPA: tyrosine-type recombinase/integrase, partial [Candidatus Paceibacterota bacterium]|nr:tyrosine-type recombinase/integrase [Candidatus Paceibacterota bacterium]
MAQKLIKYIEIDDFKKVLAAEKDKKFKLAYALAFGSGLRISEIVGYGEKIKPLTKEMIDLEKHQIKLLGKRNKERITVTSPWLNKTNILLLPLDIQRRTLQRRFTNLCQKILNKHLSIHTLRHGFANRLVNEKNLPLPMAQSMLGHEKLSTTG